MGISCPLAAIRLLLLIRILAVDGPETLPSRHCRCCWRVKRQRSRQINSLRPIVKSVWGFSSDSPLIFRQWLALGFRGPNQCDNADEVDRRHDHGHRAERHQGAQPAKQKWKWRGQVTDGVIAEADASAPQAGGEYFRKINRLAGKTR